MSNKTYMTREVSKCCKSEVKTGYLTADGLTRCWRCTKCLLPCYVEDVDELSEMQKGKQILEELAEIKII